MQHSCFELFYDYYYDFPSFSSSAYHGVYNTLSTVACLSFFYGYVAHGRQQVFHPYNLYCAKGPSSH